MIRQHWLLIVVAIVLALSNGRATAALLLYEPFNYPVGYLLSATPIGAANTTNSPIGYMAPNFNNWYGTGIDAGGYQTLNDAEVVDYDMHVPGLAKPSLNSKSLLLGGAGHSMRLSLNSSTMATPNRTSPNLSDIADPLAGTNGTFQSTDTAGTAYYSIAFRIPTAAALTLSGGVLLGFNGEIGANTTNPTNIGAALAIRPKGDGNTTEFQLGILKQGTTNLAAATWDPTFYDTTSTIFVVGKYQTVGSPQNASPAETNDLASLWINPPSASFGGFEPPGALTNSAGDDLRTNSSTNNHTLQSFVLRQSGPEQNLQIPIVALYDELRVGTTWADVTPGVAGDYIGNGSVDAADYVLWRSGGPLANEVVDRTTVNSADYGAWRARFGTPIYGDYNNDGAVNAADYVLWRKGGPLANEGDNPGTIDAADYSEWRSRFGGTGGTFGMASASAIPEPGAVWLIAVVAIAACATRGPTRCNWSAWRGRESSKTFRIQKHIAPRKNACYAIALTTPGPVAPW